MGKSLAGCCRWLRWTQSPLTLSDHRIKQSEAPSRTLHLTAGSRGVFRLNDRARSYDASTDGLSLMKGYLEVRGLVVSAKGAPPTSPPYRTGRPERGWEKHVNTMSSVARLVTL